MPTHMASGQLPALDKLCRPRTQAESRGTGQAGPGTPQREQARGEQWPRSCLEPWPVGIPPQQRPVRAVALEPGHVVGLLAVCPP